MELIPRNVERFTRQLRRVGLMYDWNHTVDTTQPEYYRWTQWIFFQLYKAGLAVKKEAPVNWCPSCNTVLSNEQVVGGECERCGTPVEQRVLSQWFFRITQYAGRLLDNLATLDWSETTKKAQENWIGRSEGAEIVFPVARGKASEDRHEPTCFTSSRMRSGCSPPVRTRSLVPRTWCSPPSIRWWTRSPLPEQRAAVDACRERVAATDPGESPHRGQGKTGVDTGARAINPINGEEIPVWIADYVLMEYGTGAIMAVPATTSVTSSSRARWA